MSSARPRASLRSGSGRSQTSAGAVGADFKLAGLGGVEYLKAQAFSVARPLSSL